MGGHGSAADRADVLCARRVGSRTGRVSPDGAGTTGQPTHQPRSPRAERPNILLLVSDDQAWSDFSPALMPSVYGQLVDQGVLFKRAYVNTSLCCPSRAQIVTGLYEHHTGVDTNTVPLERPTIVEALHDVGYRTMLAGKYLNSWPCTPRPEFDRWACVGHPHPVDVLHDQPGDQRGRRVVELPGLSDRHPRGSARGLRPGPPRRTSRSSRCTRRRRRTCRRTTRGTTPCPSPRRATHRSTTTPSATTRRCTRAAPPLTDERDRRTPTSGTPGWRAASGRSTTRCRPSSTASATGPATRSSSTCPTTDSCSASIGGSARPTRTRGPCACRWSSAIPRCSPESVHVTRPGLERRHRPDARRRSPGSRGKPTVARSSRCSMAPRRSVRSALLIEHCRGVNVGSVPCSGLSFYAHQTRAGGYWGVVTSRDKYVRYDDGDRELFDLQRDPGELQNLIGSARVGGDGRRHGARSWQRCSARTERPRS